RVNDLAVAARLGRRIGGVERRRGQGHQQQCGDEITHGDHSWLQNHQLRYLRMKASALARASALACLSPPARPWPALGTETNSCGTWWRASSLAMSADFSCGTSVSAVPWIIRIGGYFAEMLRTGQYGSSLARSVAGSKPETSLVQRPFWRR